MREKYTAVTNPSTSRPELYTATGTYIGLNDTMPPVTNPSTGRPELYTAPVSPP